MYCPPFDHQDVIEGNATIVYELKDQMQHPPDAIISCVGGGGLIGGIFEGEIILTASAKGRSPDCSI